MLPTLCAFSILRFPRSAVPSPASGSARTSSVKFLDDDDAVGAEAALINEAAQGAAGAANADCVAIGRRRRIDEMFDIAAGRSASTGRGGGNAAIDAAAGAAAAVARAVAAIGVVDTAAAITQWRAATATADAADGVEHRGRAVTATPTDDIEDVAAGCGATIVGPGATAARSQAAEYAGAAGITAGRTIAAGTAADHPDLHALAIG